MDAATLAIDIGGSKIAAGLLAPSSAQVRDVVTVPTPAEQGGAVVLETVIATARRVVETSDVGIPGAVGIASAGIVEPGTGRITHATDLIPGWTGTALGERVAAALGLPAAVLNDVHAHGLGEVHHGAAIGAARALVVAVGTGIGGCLVVDGRADVGTRGVAGHIGHVPSPVTDGAPCSCGRTGHLEGFASGSGVRAAFARRTGHDLPTARIAQLAGEEGPDRDTARELLTEAGRAMGRVIGGLLNVLDPDVVVIGGGMAAAGAPWRQAVIAGVEREAMDIVAGTPLRFSAAGPQTALLGAAHHARTTLRP